MDDVPVPHTVPQKKIKRSYSLPPAVEEILFEWVEENEKLWRRGHRQFNDSKRKKALWEDKARTFKQEFPEEDFVGETLVGWWKSMYTGYVKRLKKSGQAVKRHTDQEMQILTQCKFYESEDRHHAAAPMKSLALAPQLQAMMSLVLIVRTTTLSYP